MDEKYVLLVEDDKDDVDLTRIAFRRCQVLNKIVVTSDGQEALDFLFQQGKYIKREPDGLPTLVMLDLTMLYIDGLEALRRIRSDKRTAQLQVVILSSSDDAQDKVDCGQLGISAYYRKPESFSDYLKIIQEIQARWLA